MSYMEALAAVEQRLREQGVETAARVARDMATRRRDANQAGSSIEYGQEHAIVSHAANNILREHYAAETAAMTTLERIEYVRAMPNRQDDPVQRAYSDAVEAPLYRAHGDAVDELVDTYTGPEDGWPAALADVYARAEGLS